MSQAYKAPTISDEKLTPQLVRDELLNCFESANREFATVMKQPVTGEALKEQVKNFVQTVFNGCGVNFDHPTKQGILTAIDQCKAKAERMMGPQGNAIIQHHYDEMMKLVSRMSE